MFSFESYNRRRVYKSGFIAVSMEEALIQSPPYPEYVGKLVQVVMQGRSEVGHYIGKTSGGDIVLRPFLRSREMPETDREKRKSDEKKQSFYEWADQRLYVQHSIINIVFPPNEEDIAALVRKQPPKLVIG